jgi:hypothetical protein
MGSGGRWSHFGIFSGGEARSTGGHPGQGEADPRAKNAEPPGPLAMADMTGHAPGQPFILVETNLDPRLRGDDGGGGGVELGGGGV